MIESSEALTVRDVETVTRVGEESASLPERHDFAGYAGVATVAIGRDQAAKLAAILPDEAHDILPTGEVYVSQVHYRRLLNDVFGPAGWALVPRDKFVREGNTICREYALVGPGGRFISEAIGEAEYQPTNARMSYASACEACKSNALTRCCKDIGIASECWDKRWCERWIKENAVKVWRTDTKRRTGEKGEFQWRRRDAQPFYDEKGSGQQKGESKQKEDTRHETERDADELAPPSTVPACGHCGSVNVKADPKAPGWFRCEDCNRGTKGAL